MKNCLQCELFQNVVFNLNQSRLVQRMVPVCRISSAMPRPPRRLVVQPWVQGGVPSGENLGWESSRFCLLGKNLSSGRYRISTTEMEFLDINLTKDSSVLLHAIHSLSNGGFIKKIILYSGFKNTCKKNPRNKKIRVYSWIASCKKEKWG